MPEKLLQLFAVAIFVSFSFCFFTVNVFAVDLTVKAGIDMQSIFVSKFEAGDIKGNEGATVGAEVTIQRMKGFFYGAGAKYIIDRYMAGKYGSFKIGGMPIYGYAAITPELFKIETSKDVIPYLKVDIGYFLTAIKLANEIDTTGKAYYGFAFGTSIKHFILEVSYNLYNFANKTVKEDVNSLYTVTNITVGYRFNL